MSSVTSLLRCGEESLCDGAVARKEAQTNVLAHTPKHTQRELLPDEEKRMMRKKDGEGVTGWNSSRDVNEFLTVLKKDVFGATLVCCDGPQKQLYRGVPELLLLIHQNVQEKQV